MKITTTETIAGRLVEETLGVVRGSVLWSRRVTKLDHGGMCEILNGNMVELSDGIEQAKDGAEAKAKSQATVLGADAIINIRFELMELSNGVFQAMATGTAVKTSSLQTALPFMALADNDDDSEISFVAKVAQPNLRLVSSLMH
ncbi:MAG: heavy metal-binding domain-containing protein [Aestuariivirga sp.]